MSENSLSVFNWCLFAGDKDGIWRGEKLGYKSDDGQVITKVTYNAIKQHLTITGKNMEGRCVLGPSVYVVFTEKKNGRFRGPLSREDFKKLLLELMRSETSHRQAQIRRLDDMK